MAAGTCRPALAGPSCTDLPPFCGTAYQLISYRSACLLLGRLQIPGLFLPVGPLGMAALALLLMGTAATKAFPPTGPAGPSFMADTSPLLDMAGLGWVINYGGTYAALLFWGAAAWWMAIASVALVACRRQLSFSLAW